MAGGMATVDGTPPAGPRPAGRSRAVVAAWLAAVVAAGVLSRVVGRRAGVAVPKEVGDTLWAWMFYLWVVLCLPRLPGLAAAAAAVAITFAIEFLKLYHAPWIDALRADRYAGFLLGHTFLRHDLLCYAAGAAVGLAMDRLTRRRRAGAAGDSAVPGRPDRR